MRNGSYSAFCISHSSRSRSDHVILARLLWSLSWCQDTFLQSASLMGMKGKQKRQKGTKEAKSLKFLPFCLFCFHIGFLYKAWLYEYVLTSGLWELNTIIARIFPLRPLRLCAFARTTDWMRRLILAKAPRRKVAPFNSQRPLVRADQKSDACAD